MPKRKGNKRKGVMLVSLLCNYILQCFFYGVMTFFLRSSYSVHDIITDSFRES